MSYKLHSFVEHMDSWVGCYRCTNRFVGTSLRVSGPLPPMYQPEVGFSDR